jgi:hypothetical protein
MAMGTGLWSRGSKAFVVGAVAAACFLFGPGPARAQNCVLQNVSTFGSVIWAGSPAANQGAANAFDGTTGTVYSGISSTAPYIGRDLGTPRALRRIDYARTSSYTFSGKVQYSDNGATFVDAGVTVYMGAEDSTSRSVTIPSVGAHRYWVIRDLRDDGYHQVGELKFFACSQNEPPVVTGPANQTHSIGTSVSVSIPATDPEGRPLMFSATGLPSGLSVNASTGVISGTIGGNATVYSVIASASDGVLAATRPFTWKITDPMCSLEPATLGAVVSGGGVYPGQDAAKAFDGSLTSWYSGVSSAGTYVGLDFGFMGGRRIRRIEVPAGASYTFYGKVQYSDDGVTFTDTGYVLTPGTFDLNDLGEHRFWVIRDLQDDPYLQANEIRMYACLKFGAGTALFDSFTSTVAQSLNHHLLDIAPGGLRWHWLTGPYLPSVANGKVSQTGAWAGYTAWTVNVGLANVNVGVDVTSTAYSPSGGLVLRATDENNYLLLRYKGPYLYRRQGGQLHPLGAANLSFASGETHRIEARMSGSSIEVYADNVLVFAVTETFNQAATRHGVVWHGDDSTARLDNFSLTSTERISGPPPGNGCEVFVSPGVLYVDNHAGTYLVNTTVPPGCPVDSNSQSDFIGIVPSGKPNTVAFTIENTHTARIGYLAVGGNTVTVHQSAGTTPDCSVTAAPSSLVVPASGGSGDITISASSSCGWTAYSDHAWMSIGGSLTGIGSGTIGYHVGSNPGTERTTTLFVSGQQVRVYQAGANGSSCSYSVSPASFQIAAGTHTAQVHVVTQSGCGWTASSQTGFVGITSGFSGAGDGTVSFHIESNDSGEERAGHVTVAGTVVAINQSGSVGCDYSVMPTVARISPASESGAVVVTTAPGCVWSAHASGFLSVIGEMTRSGPGVLMYTAPANPSTSSRTDSLLIAGTTVSITQSGMLSVTNHPSESCPISLSLDAVAVPASGGNRVIDFFTPQTCSWEADSTDSWITITSQTGGTGSDGVEFSVAGNTGSARSGAVVVGSHVIEVFQGGNSAPETTEWQTEWQGVQVSVTNSGAIVYGPYASMRWESYPNVDAPGLNSCFGNCGAGCSSRLNPCGGRTQWWELQILTEPQIIGNSSWQDVLCYGEPNACYLYTFERYQAMGRWIYHGFAAAGCQIHDTHCNEFLWGATCLIFGGCGTKWNEDWQYDDVVVGSKIVSIEELP